MIFLIGSKECIWGERKGLFLFFFVDLRFGFVIFERDIRLMFIGSDLFFRNRDLFKLV